jgi:hypothetical protein
MIAKFLLAIVLLTLSINAKADIFTEILGQLVQQTNLQQQIQQYTSQMTDLEQQTLQTMIGNYGYGSLDYNPNLQSWGNNTGNWNSLLSSYQQSDNGVGQIAQQHNQQFPIQQSSVANPNPQSLDAKYNSVLAQTALAMRSASEYDYNNIQTQITYLQQLHDQIDKTTNLKAAIDLQNRTQYESSSIQIELLRLTALSNQQQAIESQGESNTVVNNANTFQLRRS